MAPIFSWGIWTTSVRYCHIVNYRRVNATASQETHETTTSTLAPEGRVPALERIT
jgi:regulatory protein YycH of two-component signal transduction system YycFG